MAILRFFLGLLLAICLDALVLWLDPRAGRVFDPFLILVLYNSLRSAPLGSAATGSVVGLVHDALTGGLFGLHGFADTLIGYLASVVRQRFVIQQPLQVGLLCLLGAAAQAVVLTLLQFLLLADSDLPTPADAGLSALITGGLGAALYIASRRAFAWDRGRRERRHRRLRLDT